MFLSATDRFYNVSNVLLCNNSRCVLDFKDILHTARNSTRIVISNYNKYNVLYFLDIRNSESIISIVKIDTMFACCHLFVYAVVFCVLNICCK